MIKQRPIIKDNYDIGRGGYSVEAVVIHIMQGTMEGTYSWFNGENIKNGIYSSAHEGISKQGDVDVYVAPENAAYHAGRINQPIWSGMKKTVLGTYVNPNKHTYGIECEGFRGDIFTEAQMVSLVARTKAVCDKYGLPYSRSKIISHHEITADKENMSAWCDEVVKRLNAPPVNQIDTKVEIKKKLQELTELVNKL